MQTKSKYCFVKFDGGNDSTVFNISSEKFQFPVHSVSELCNAYILLNKFI